MNVYLKMMEKFCQGSIVVQTKVKAKRKKRIEKPKKLSKEEIEVSAKIIFNLNYPTNTRIQTKKASNISVFSAGKVGQRLGRTDLS